MALPVDPSLALGTLQTLACGLHVATIIGAIRPAKDEVTQPPLDVIALLRIERAPLLD